MLSVVFNSISALWKFEQSYLIINRGNLCRNISHAITIQNNPEYKWSYQELSINPNITIDIVKNNPDKPWNYYNLSQNPNITWEIVQNNPQIPWSYRHLSMNPNIRSNCPPVMFPYTLRLSSSSANWDPTLYFPDNNPLASTE